MDTNCTRPGWDWCSAGHPHRAGRPSVNALCLDSEHQVLTVPAPWSTSTAVRGLPIAAIPPGQRAGLTALHVVASALKIPMPALGIVGRSHEDPCELSGLRLYVVTPADERQVHNAADGDRARWVELDVDKHAGLELVDRAVGAVWDRALALSELADVGAVRKIRAAR